MLQGKRILIKLYLLRLEKTDVLCQIDILQAFCLTTQNSQLLHFRKTEGYKLNKNPQQPENAAKRGIGLDRRAVKYV